MSNLPVSQVTRTVNESVGGTPQAGGVSTNVRTWVQTALISTPADPLGVNKVPYQENEKVMYVHGNGIGLPSF